MMNGKFSFACVASLLVATLSAPCMLSAEEDLTLVGKGEVKSITAHSVCREISNEGSSDIMAPHRKSTEWAVGKNAFIFNTADMQDVYVAECGTPAEPVPDEAPFAYVRETMIFPNVSHEKAMWNNLSGDADVSGDFDDIVSRYPYCVDQDGNIMSYAMNINHSEIDSSVLRKIAMQPTSKLFYKDSKTKNEFIRSLNVYYDNYKGQAYIPENADVCNMTFNLSGNVLAAGGIFGITIRYISYDFLLAVERE